MPNAMTLVIPLKAKDGMALQDFYDYWLNAHVTLPPRFPGISSVWLHKTSLADPLWPAIDGVSAQPDEDDTFDGVPEATFPTMDDLQAFIKASRVQMEDGINFLSQEIGYAALGANSATARDATDPAPDGTDTYVRHLVFLRKRPDVSVPDFRAWVDDVLVPGLAASDEVLKLRRHLFEELDITLDHPGVTMTKPMERPVPGDGRGRRRRRGRVRAVRRFRGLPVRGRRARTLVRRRAPGARAALHHDQARRSDHARRGARCRGRRPHPQGRREQPDARRRVARVPAARRPGPQLTGRPPPPPCQAPPVNVDELALAACVDPADVRVVLTWLDDGRATDDEVPLPTAIAVHRLLNPDSERTFLPLYYKR